jgi:hypothetical protein
LNPGSEPGCHAALCIDDILSGKDRSGDIAAFTGQKAKTAAASANHPICMDYLDFRVTKSMVEATVAVLFDKMMPTEDVYFHRRVSFRTGALSCRPTRWLRTEDQFYY